MTECRNLQQVRENIDRLDRAIVPLLAERAGYVAQAARFKDSIEDVVVPERIEDIVAGVRALAAEHGTDPDLMEAIYRSMIDAYIAFERRQWRALKG